MKDFLATFTIAIYTLFLNVNANILIRNIVTVILGPTILTFFLKTFSNDILDLLIPMNYTRPRVLPLMMEYFIDQEKFFYYIAIYINVTISLGALSVFVTEVNSMAVVYHICGLLKIVW